MRCGASGADWERRGPDRTGKAGHDRKGCSGRRRGGRGRRSPGRCGKRRASREAGIFCGRALFFSDERPFACVILHVGWIWSGNRPDGGFRMKRILLVLVVMVSLFSSLPAEAEVLELKKHKDWSSFVLVTPTRMAARMTTMQGGTMLAIDVEPASSGSTWSIKMLEYLSGDSREFMEGMGNFSRYGQMRVDRRTTYDVRFDFYVQSDVLIIEMGGQFHDIFLREASKGAVLRIKIEDLEPIYAKFSLQGFTAALNRCMDLADVIGSIPSDEDFFSDTRPPSDEDFFEDTGPGSRRESVPGQGVRRL